MTQDLGLEEALNIAMDAELKAATFYAQAAVEVEHPQGRDLLGRLAAFEQHHYEKLAELVESLQLGGQFIEYEMQEVADFRPSGGAPQQPDFAAPSGEAAGMHVGDLGDVASILSKAIANEKQAGERYRALFEGTSDSVGQDMFRKLANEELMHQRILEDEFFSISNQGTWGWSGMYGE